VAKPASETSRDSPRGPVWPHLRGALLLLHLVAITLMALPAPVGSDQRSNYEGPEAEAELQALSDGLARVGLDVPPDAIVDWSVSTSARVLALRRAALAPFQPYYRWAGTRQGYRMFSAVALRGNRLTVEVDRGDGWELLYLARSARHTWRRSQLDHELTRSMLDRYTRKRYRKRYDAVTEWIARQVAVDVPDAERVRVSFRHAPIQTAAQSRAGEIPPTLQRRTRVVEVRR